MTRRGARGISARTAFAQTQRRRSMSRRPTRGCRPIVPLSCMGTGAARPCLVFRAGMNSLVLLLSSSLGGAVAIQLAFATRSRGRPRIAGVVLENTFTSTAEMAAKVQCILGCCVVLRRASSLRWISADVPAHRMASAPARRQVCVRCLVLGASHPLASVAGQRQPARFATGALLGIKRRSDGTARTNAPSSRCGRALWCHLHLASVRLHRGAGQGIRPENLRLIPCPLCLPRTTKNKHDALLLHPRLGACHEIATWLVAIGALGGGPV